MSKGTIKQNIPGKNKPLKSKNQQKRLFQLIKMQKRLTCLVATDFYRFLEYRWFEKYEEIPESISFQKIKLHLKNPS
jgi:hypothetical protein